MQPHPPQETKSTLKLIPTPKYTQPNKNHRNNAGKVLFNSAISTRQIENEPREIKANQMTQNTRRAFSKTTKPGRNQP